MNNIVPKSLADGLPGEAVIYFTGDRIRSTAEVRAARTLYNEGRVELVQKRNPSGQFDYIAIFRYSRAKVPSGFRFTNDLIERN